MRTLYESIMDADELVDNMEINIFNSLRSPDTFIDAYENLCKYFKKQKWLVGPTKVETGIPYIIFNRSQAYTFREYPYFTYRVSLCIPNNNRWDVYSIMKFEYCKSNSGWPKLIDDKLIRFHEQQNLSAVVFKKQRFDVQSIFRLPQYYIDAINIFKK